MVSWTSLLRQPPGDTDHAIAAWFEVIAERLLNHSLLQVAGQFLRIVEIEFYYHGSDHLDPFTHRDSLQQECGRWYFHRQGNGYRGGSFKGLDLTFGAGAAHGGILLRSLEHQEGKLVDGPCVCVDALLRASAAGAIGELDQRIGGRHIWDQQNPLLLRPCPNLEPRAIYRSARIGLTLRRATTFSSMPTFVGRPYRFLTQPAGIKKGKPLLVLALHSQGIALPKIQELTRCPAAAIERYTTAYEVGRQRTDFGWYLGKDLTVLDRCKLQGTWHTLVGKPETSRAGNGMGI
jgi:hypothetical protein